ncbi:hypothetical protein H0H81_004407 [Sphagnurus paluster]|uniref:L-arabinokinase n=1 Tax=Sphagnurus paluster TaxID=117069 RepID=A0A9P7K5V6_9AGAR|nr:hypothetical protein H0H81_004407 [Sphagnurus paluster]
MPSLAFAYYCSGHGYGHATRVSAFACHLLDLPNNERPTIYITSSAPKHVFADSIALGAVYRYAEIDPVIVQPLAYRVDRQKSVDVLKSFLSRKDAILEGERRWLEEVKAHAVLSDAAFLGCLAAKAAGIPSILITNFTFDSVYSYLSTPLLQVDLESSAEPDHLTPASSHDILTDLVPDIPVPSEDVDLLVAQIFEGYRCADLLFLLPGCIPIPSFSIYPCLPSPEWVDASLNQFRPNVIESLSQLPSSDALHPTIPFPSFISLVQTPRKIPRSVVRAPLLVRAPSSTPSVYTPGGRSRLLFSIGVPPHLHDPDRTKILIVSFGGQVFRAPSRSASRSQSRSTTPTPSPTTSNHPSSSSIFEMQLPQPLSVIAGSHVNGYFGTITASSSAPVIPPRLATPSHIWIPGAPPASKPTNLYSPIASFSVPQLATIPPTPSGVEDTFGTLSEVDLVDEDDDWRMLPDDSWIAIVCGAAKDMDDKTGAGGTGLPEGFYVAPRDVYMPDLTAVGDVLLGKLEHGLRLLLDRDGLGVELSRQSYEAGEWVAAVEEAWARGKASKARKRADAALGIGMDKRKEEGAGMAREVVSWTQDWWEVRRN